MGKKWSKFQMLSMKMKFTGSIALSTMIPKYNFSVREALISGEGRPENLREMVKNRETYCYVN